MAQYSSKRSVTVAAAVAAAMATPVDAFVMRTVTGSGVVACGLSGMFVDWIGIGNGLNAVRFPEPPVIFVVIVASTVAVAPVVPTRPEMVIVANVESLAVTATGTVSHAPMSSNVDAIAFPFVDTGIVLRKMGASAAAVAAVPPSVSGK
jgi:hypothetical protein